jgi:hypothetical protein
MQKTINIKKGQELWAESFTGEVIEDRQWTDTTLDARTSLNGQRIAISSKATDKMHFWLRGADGTEKPFELHDSGLQARKGHILTVVDGGVGNKGTPVLLFQHTTGQSINFFKTKAMDTFDASGIDGKTSILVCLLGLALFMSLIGIPVLILWVAIGMTRTYKLRKRFLERFESVAAQFKAQGESEAAALKAQKAAAA